MSGLVSLLGWSFLPNLVTGFVQNLYYSLTIRAGSPRPQPGSPRFAEHRRRIHILVIALYLAYTIYEADYDVRREGSFYQDLGVLPTATDREIKARFRRLAALHHPDKVGAIASGGAGGGSGGGGAQAAATAYFVHLKTAADTLLDPARRFAYDRFGPASVAWAAAARGGGEGAEAAGGGGGCVTIADFVALGVRLLVPYYTVAAGALYGLGLLGYLSWGRYARWLVLGSVLAFELHLLTRPAHPRLLTHVVNPLLGGGRHSGSSWLHAPVLPFQAIALARKLSVTTYLGFAQIGPMLGADTRSGQIVFSGGSSGSSSSSSSSGGGGGNSHTDAEARARQLAALDQLDAVAASLDADATRLLEMELAPFAGQDEETLRAVRGKIKEWLVQNTIRADPMVRDAVSRSLQRRRADAPAADAAEAQE